MKALGKQQNSTEQQKRSAIIAAATGGDSHDGDQLMAKLFKYFTDDQRLMGYPDAWFANPELGQMLFTLDIGLMKATKMKQSFIMDSKRHDLITACIQRTLASEHQYLTTEVLSTLLGFWLRVIHEYQDPNSEQLAGFSTAERSQWLQSRLANISRVLDCHPCYLHPADEIKEKNTSLHRLNDFIFTQIIDADDYPFLTITLMNNMKEYYQHEQHLAEYPGTDFNYFVLHQFSINRKEEAELETEYHDGTALKVVDSEKLTAVLAKYSTDQVLSLIHFIEDDYLHHLMCREARFCTQVLQTPYFTRHFTVYDWTKLIGAHHNDRALLKIISEHKQFIQLRAAVDIDAVAVLSDIGYLLPDGNDRLAVDVFYQTQVQAVEDRLVPVKLPATHLAMMSLSCFQQAIQEYVKAISSGKNPSQKPLRSTFDKLIKTIQALDKTTQAVALRQVLLHEEVVDRMTEKESTFNRFLQISLEDTAAVMQMRWPTRLHRGITTDQSLTPAIIIANSINHAGLNGYLTPEQDSSLVFDEPAPLEVNAKDLEYAMKMLEVKYTNAKGIDTKTTLADTQDGIYKIKIQGNERTFSLHAPSQISLTTGLADDNLAVKVKRAKQRYHTALTILQIDQHFVPCVINKQGLRMQLLLALPGATNTEKMLLTANIKHYLENHLSARLGKDNLSLYCFHVGQANTSNQAIAAFSIFHDMLATLIWQSNVKNSISSRRQKQTPFVCINTDDTPNLVFTITRDGLAVNARGLTLHAERDTASMADNPSQQHAATGERQSQVFLDYLRAGINLFAPDHDFLQRNQEHLEELEQKPAVKDVAKPSFDHNAVVDELIFNPLIHLVALGYVEDHQGAVPHDRDELLSPDNQLYIAARAILAKSPLATSLPYFTPNADDNEFDAADDALVEAMRKTFSLAQGEIPFELNHFMSPMSIQGTPANVAARTPVRPNASAASSGYGGTPSPSGFAATPYAKKFSPVRLDFNTPDKAKAKQPAPMAKASRGIDSDESESDNDAKSPTSMQTPDADDRVGNIKLVLQRVKKVKSDVLAKNSQTKTDYANLRASLRKLEAALENDANHHAAKLDELEPRVIETSIRYAKLIGQALADTLCFEMYSNIANFLKITVAERQFVEVNRSYEASSDAEQFKLFSSNSARTSRADGNNIRTKSMGDEGKLRRAKSLAERGSQRNRAGSSAERAVDDHDFVQKRNFRLSHDWNSACEQLLAAAKRRWPVHFQAYVDDQVLDDADAVVGMPATPHK